MMVAAQRRNEVGDHLDLIKTATHNQPSSVRDVCYKKTGKCGDFEITCTPVTQTSFKIADPAVPATPHAVATAQPIPNVNPHKMPPTAAQAVPTPSMTDMPVLQPC